MSKPDNLKEKRAKVKDMILGQNIRYRIFFTPDQTDDEWWIMRIRADKKIVADNLHKYMKSLGEDRDYDVETFKSFLEKKDIQAEIEYIEDEVFAGI